MKKVFKIDIDLVLDHYPERIVRLDRDGQEIARYRNQLVDQLIQPRDPEAIQSFGLQRLVFGDIESYTNAICATFMPEYKVGAALENYLADQDSSVEWLRDRMIKCRVSNPELFVKDWEKAITVRRQTNTNS